MTFLIQLAALYAAGVLAHRRRPDYSLGRGLAAMMAAQLWCMVWLLATMAILS